MVMTKRSRESEIRAELPQLAYLFGAYFHQDSDLDGTPDGIVDSFIRSEWPHASRQARLELVALLGRPYDDRELQQAIVDLGADVVPTPSGIGLRGWLEGVRDRLAQAPLTRFAMAVPIIPARETEASAAWYRDQLSFQIVHCEPEYAIVERDDIGVHLWGPSGIPPEESNTMFRIRVGGIDELYEYCNAKGLVHPNAPLEEKPWGAREFAITDLDGNLLTFFER